LALTRNFFVPTRLRSSNGPERDRTSVNVACADASANSPSAWVLTLLIVSHAWW
jgi:hypothetical protein